MGEAKYLRRYSINQSNKIIIIVLFIIYPLGSLPLILWEIYNKRKYAYVLFSIFVGLSGMLYAPNGDLYRYYEDYYNYANLSFDEFNLILIIQANLDFGLPYIQFLFSKIGISNDIIVFLCIGLGTLYTLLITFDYTQQLSKNNSFIIFIFVCLFITFWSYYFRYGFASILFAYGIHLINYRESKAGWTYIVLSPLFHFGLIVFVIIYNLIYLLKYNLSRKYFLIFAITSLLFTGDIISELLLSYAFPPAISGKIAAYTEGYWANEWLNDRSIGSILLNYVDIIIRIVVYYIIFRNFKRNNVYTLLTVMLVLITIAGPFAIVAGRFNWTFNIVSLNVIIPILCKKYRLLAANSISVLLYIMCIISTIGTFSMRRYIIPVSREDLLLKSSSIGIITHRYDDKWLREHTELGE